MSAIHLSARGRWCRAPHFRLAYELHPARSGGNAMPYVIQTQDKPDSAQIRAQARPAHLEYLTRNQDKLLAAGALIDDDGTGGHGGVLIVDTDDRAEAERFINEDPFSKAGLFAKVTVTRWRKAFFNKEKLI
jgi:uncharacterized protein YciI